MKKFTFKTEKSTGRYAAFFADIHHIKLNKIQCGEITDGEGFRIRLQVIKKDIMEDGNANCSWKWVTMKKISGSLQEAKDWLNSEEVRAAIEKIYTIYLDE